MLNLNLLPPKEKKALMYEVRARAALVMGGFLGAALVIFLILLLPTLFFLVFQKAEIVRSVEIERQRHEQISLQDRKNQVRQMNDIAVATARHLSDSKSIFELFQSIIVSVPAGIHIDAIRFDWDESTIDINGFSPTRAIFLAYVNALDNHPLLEEVSSPVANLVRENDITFTISASIR